MVSPTTYIPGLLRRFSNLYFRYSVAKPNEVAPVMCLSFAQIRPTDLQARSCEAERVKFSHPAIITQHREDDWVRSEHEYIGVRCS